MSTSSAEDTFEIRSEKHKRLAEVAATEMIDLERPKEERALATPTLPAGTVSFTASERSLPRIPGYEILAELGRGGMGVVYKARQTSLNRIVALKMVLGSVVADPHFMARFRSEAEAVARLQHANIVQIFSIEACTIGPDLGCAYPFFVQEFVEGGNLADWLDRKPQAPRAIAQFMETVARATHYAHEQGIIHRDLKPANIFLRKRGGSGEHLARNLGKSSGLSAFEPKLGDFGLAKLLDGSGQARTQTGMVAGTPEYMAPEQAVGALNLGPAADTYALGVILYELATGRRPLEGTSVLETMYMVRHQEPLPPSRFQPKFPRDLETICLKCLRKEPYKRYGSALELAEDLRRYLDGEPIHARPVGAMERLWRWAQRRPAVAALAALLIVSALLGVGGISAASIYALRGWSEADRQRQSALEKQTEADSNRQRAEEEKATAELRREEAELNLYFSRIAQARMESRLSNPVAANLLLDQCLPSSGSTQDRRSWEWHYLKGLLNEDLLTVPAPHNSFVTAVRFSADGERILSGGGVPFRTPPPEEVKIWQAFGPKSGQLIGTIKYSSMIRDVQFADYERRVAWVGQDNQICLAELETGKMLASWKLPEKYDLARLSPDSRWYASVNDLGDVKVWELESGKEKHSIQGSARHPRGMSFSPDGTQLAITFEAKVCVYDWEKQSEIASLSTSRHVRGSPVFSQDGRMIAVATSYGQVLLYDSKGGKLLQAIAGHTGAVLGIAFSPEGKHLATASADRTARIWDIESGSELLLLRGHQGRVGCLAFHPSGCYLVTGGEQPSEIKIWDLTREQEYVRSPRTQAAWGRVEGLAFSKDGESVLAARSSSKLQIISARSGVDREIKRIDLTEKWLSPTSLATFDANGELLATVSHQLRVVVVTDLKSGKEFEKLAHDLPVEHVKFASGAGLLVTSSMELQPTPRREIDVWEYATGRQVLKLPIAYGTPPVGFGSVAATPDGKCFAHDEIIPNATGNVAEDPKGFLVRVRETATGQVTDTIGEFASPLCNLAFSPDGALLAISTEDNGMSLYDCQLHRYKHATLPGTTLDWYTDAVFSPDGRRLAALSREALCIWDVETGQKVITLIGAPPRPSDNGYNPHIAWSQDGHRLAAGTWDQNVSIWDSADMQAPLAKQRLYQVAEERGRNQQAARGAAGK